MDYEEIVLTADDAAKLFVRNYQPVIGDSARTLIFVHGMSEHGGRYGHVARKFVEQGWQVIVPDMRGHGLSGGVPMHVDDFDQYNRDLEVIRQHFGRPPEQTAILGHSLGALLSIRYVQQQAGRVSAAVLLSPLLKVKVPIPWTTIALGKLLTFVAPRTRFSSTVDPKLTTRTQEIREQREKDTLIHDSVTAAWYFAMTATLRAAWDDAEKLRIPVLIMQAGSDGIVDPEAPERWLLLTGSCDRTFRSLDDHFHELHHEPSWEETIAHIQDWLDQRIPPAGQATQQCIA